MDLKDCRTSSSEPENSTSPEFEGGYSYRITNRIPLTVEITVPKPDGDTQGVRIHPGEDCDISTTDDEILIRSLTTGSNIGVFKHSGGNGTTSIFLDHRILVNPNEIGQPPKPSGKCPVPTDSTKTLVGYGFFHEILPFINVKMVVARSQYWRRSANSVSLGPGEQRTLTHTVFFGKDETSSHISHLSEQIGINASVGWGFFSSSVSASLNRKSTTSHSVTLRSEETATEEEIIKNDSNRERTYLRWQLCDVIDFILWKDHPRDNHIIASVSTIEFPVVTRVFESDTGGWKLIKR